MSDKFIKIPTSELKFGMFIAELDKPWLDTPFLVQGFVLKEPGQRQILVDQCQFVVVDTGKCQSSLFAPAKRVSLGTSLQQTFTKSKLKIYEDQSSFDEEIAKATKIYDAYEETVGKIFGEYGRSKKIDLRAANEAVGTIVGSIVRNPDACILLQQMRRKGDYLYNHAIGTSI